MSKKCIPAFVLGSTALAASVLFCGPVMAQDSSAEIQQLRSSVDALQAKVDQLEAGKSESSGFDMKRLLPEGMSIYGQFDSGVEYVTNVGANKDSLTRVPSTTGSGPSRIGFNFRHQATDSVAAVARAEMGIYLDTGTSGQGSRLFGRQMYVGLDANKLGALTFGRQYNMMYIGTGPGTGDLMGPDIYGLGSIDPYIPNGRADNTVAWNNKIGHWTLGATYSFGRDIASTVPASGTCSGEVATNTSGCRDWSAMIWYGDKNYALVGAIDKQMGGNGAAVNFFNGASTFSMTDSEDWDRRITINGWIRATEDLRFAAGWLGRDVKSVSADMKVSQDTFWLQGEYTMGHWAHTLAVYHTKNDLVDAKSTLLSVRAQYNFDKQTAAYVTMGYVDNNSVAGYGVSGGGSGASPAVGNDQLGTMVGVRYRF